MYINYTKYLRYILDITNDSNTLFYFKTNLLIIDNKIRTPFFNKEILFNEFFKTDIIQEEKNLFELFAWILTESTLIKYSFFSNPYFATILATTMAILWISQHYFNLTGIDTSFVINGAGRPQEYLYNGFKLYSYQEFIDLNDINIYHINSRLNYRWWSRLINVTTQTPKYDPAKNIFMMHCSLDKSCEFNSLIVNGFELP